MSVLYELRHWANPADCQVVRTDEFEFFAAEVAKIAKKKNRGLVLVGSQEINMEAAPAQG